LLNAFPPEGVKILWRADVGSGWSSPVVASGKVFVADALVQSPHARERLHCFDAATGKEIWTREAPVRYPEWAFAADQNAGPTATPAIAHRTVYVVGGNGAVECLAAATGEVVWAKDLAKSYEIAELQCRASPLIDGDHLILFVGGKPGASVLALDRHSGAEVWKALSEPASNSSPIIVSAGGRRQLIVWTGESVTSLDPATGETFWREPMTTSNNDAVATPVCVGDLLLVGGLMFQLDADKPAATVLWPENRGISKRILSSTSTAMLTKDSVFSATNRGDLVCLEARTGREVWRTDKVTDHKTGSSIHITPNGDTAFLYTNAGELIHARLTPSGYEEIGRALVIAPVYTFAGRKVTWSPPAFADRHVFVRDERELVCASLAADTPAK
jgi:outer membrane protein assembly factor BamB